MHLATTSDNHGIKKKGVSVSSKTSVQEHEKLNHTISTNDQYEDDDMITDYFLPDDDVEEENTTSEDPSLPANEYDGILNKKLQLHKTSGHENIPLDSTDRTHIELLHLLKSTGCSPKYMFNQIMQWAHKATILHNHDFRIFPQTRQKVVNDLYRKFDMKGLEPKEMDFCMPGSGETVKIIYHNIHEVIYSLLQDKDLMQPANLLFDGDDPFHKDVNSTARSSLF
jgi:hypothetical protein